MAIHKFFFSLFNMIEFEPMSMMIILYYHIKTPIEFSFE